MPTPTTIRLAPAVEARLSALSARLGMNRTALVNCILDEHFESGRNVVIAYAKPEAPKPPEPVATPEPTKPADLTKLADRMREMYGDDWDDDA